MTPCFILCSGPSFFEFDLSRLDPVDCITCNWAQEHFQADYHCFSDWRHWTEGCQKRCKSAKCVWTLAPNTAYPMTPTLGSGLREEFFSTDLTQGAYAGETTAYFALQVAWHLEAKEIYFIGLDLGPPDGVHEFEQMRLMLNKGGQWLWQHGVPVYNFGRAKIESIPNIDANRKL